MSLIIAPGVRQSKATVKAAEDAAGRVAVLAEKAARAGTFGVGGLLVDRTGRVWAEATNAVIQGGLVSDPTAHAERQLVDWYCAVGEKLGLPSPSSLTIVTSLEPCAMCTGAILRAGFSAVAVAEDPQSGFLGNHSSQSILRTIVKRLRMFPVVGLRRSIVSEDCLKGDVTRASYDRCKTAFEHSLKMTRDLIGGEYEADAKTRIASPRPGTVAKVAYWRKSSYQIKNILRVKEGAKDRSRALFHSKNLKRVYGLQGSKRVGPTAVRMHVLNVNPDELLERLRSHHVDLPSSLRALPDESVLGVGEFRSAGLRKLLSNRGSCLVDSIGRILLIADEGPGPVRDSVLELIRGYTALRRYVFKDTGSQALPHPRTCSILKVSAPASFDQAFLQFGAAGSFLEAPRYPIAAPLLMYLDGVEDRVMEWADMLPDFYKEIGVKVGRYDPNLPFVDYAEQQRQSMGAVDQEIADRLLMN
jgi:tRNA(Arg) A34 adenosine deaminase TadA